MKCVPLVSMGMPQQALHKTAVFVNVLWELPPTALLVHVPLILSIIFCAPVRKAILDRTVRGVLMVSMAIHLNLGIIVRGANVVVTLIPASMEAATLRQGSALNASMLQQVTSATAA